jgi:radical SAM superfamily enzyme YgiQ (UPF0313 family)
VTAKITLVQQGVWHMQKESMPLAIGYLAAIIAGHERLSGRCFVEIKNYDGKKTAFDMAADLLCGSMPDIVGFSVLGWNIHQFASVAHALKQANPSIVVVFGGNHVANQAASMMARFPEVDIIVNGEGETSFPELVQRLLDGRPLVDVPGISYRSAGGVETTPNAERIADLDTIPSPILTGTIPLVDSTGAFRYDVALLETNRGCPYKCSFCYWGGATGQRIRSFSRKRLRDELTALAQVKAETVVLCDSNFGMLRQDVEFMEDFLAVRKEYGYPLALETSWAKNKSKAFYEIVRMMVDAGMKSSFTLALQTLNGETLTGMQRKNMRINDWKDMVKWLNAVELDCYAELIWGAPGETPESFLAGYDELAEYVSRIAAYPLLLLPNTDYWERREHYGFVTVKGIRDDFDYVLATNTASVTDHLRMQHFLFWARLLAENLVFRHIWRPLRLIGGLRQSQVLESFGEFAGQSDLPLARQLCDLCASSMADPDSLSPALLSCFGEIAFDQLALAWWAGSIEPLLPPAWRDPLAELLRYDLDSRPLPNPDSRNIGDYFLVEEGGEEFYAVHRQYRYDIGRLTALAAAETEFCPSSQPPAATQWRVRLAYKTRFGEIAASTNHEETAHFVARIQDALPVYAGSAVDVRSMSS